MYRWTVNWSCIASSKPFVALSPAPVLRQLPASSRTQQAEVRLQFRVSARGSRHYAVGTRSAPSPARMQAAQQDTGLIRGDVFFLDPFAVRQWDDPNYAGTLMSHDKVDFVEKVHEFYAASGNKLVDGYADFCKHVFVPNFPGARAGHLAITPENEHLMRSGYKARKEGELAVLQRWFPADKVEAPTAKMLDIILYSREQLVKEREAMGEGGRMPLPEGVPWGIISIKAQDEDFELPMQPITMMRNALGREEGGSGVPINKDAYRDSVAYWEKHAPIVS
eukprot:jgi/Mesvir1/23628/Mv18304-RA.1